MTASQIREYSRESLKGKWGKAALMTLCFSAITLCINTLCGFIPFLGSIILLVIEVPISYGIIVSFIKLKRDEEVGYIDFLTIGFSSFSKVWKVSGCILLKMIVPIAILLVVYLVFIILGASILTMFSLNGSSALASSAFAQSSIWLCVFLIIACIAYFACIIWLIVKSYLYSLSFLILYDNPDFSAKDIVIESENLMKGNRWKYFCLMLSFIGWILLSAFSLYIGLLWVIPYMFIASVCFYEHLSNNISSKDVVDNVDFSAIAVENRSTNYDQDDDSEQ